MVPRKLHTNHEVQSATELQDNEYFSRQTKAQQVARDIHNLSIIEHANNVPEQDLRSFIPNNCFGIGEYLIENNRFFASILLPGDNKNDWDQDVLWLRYRGMYTQSGSSISTILTPGEHMDTQNAKGNPLVMSNIEGQLFKNGKPVSKLAIALKHRRKPPLRHQVSD